MTDLKEVPINFLLTCSDKSLDNFRLAHMALAANLRKDLLAIVDQLIDENTQIALALWFKLNDRETLKRALETEEDAMTWARRMIRGGGEILPRLRMDPGEARKHRRESSKKYQAANIAAGKCRVCGEPVCRESVQHCTKHLEKSRARQQERTKKLGKAPQGRHPNTLAALAKGREKQSSNKGDGQ
jgi:hypothetical protein